MTNKLKKYLNWLNTKSALLKPSKIRLNNYLSSPGHVFVSLSLVFGLITILVMPILMVPDETVHFYRAYQIGEGHILSEVIDNKIGGFVPRVQGEGMVVDRRDPIIVPQDYFSDARPEEFTEFPTAAAVSPVAYLPQSIGINLGRLINGSVGSMVLVGRLFNLIAYILMVTIAILIARRGKWVYAVVALFPVSIQQAASLSADATTIGTAFITIALIERLFMQKEKLNKKQLALLIVLSIVIGLSKPTNAILLAPLVLLPTRIFSKLKIKFGVVATLLLICFISICSWYLSIKHAYGNLNSASAIGLEGVDPIAQTKYLLQEPFSFFETLFRTYVFEGFGGIPTAEFYLTSMYGVFSWLTYKLPLAFILMGYTLLLTAFLYVENKDLDSKRLKQLSVIQTGIFLASLVSIALALYLVWTKVGSSQVSGIQGRYFIPIIPLLIPLFVLLSQKVRVTFSRPEVMGQLVVGISSLNLIVFSLLTLVWFY